MIDKMKEYGLWLWDWVKRIFGRSKIIFANVMGATAEVWIMIYDPVSMFNWDSVVGVDKHDVAVMIGIAITALNVILRKWFTDAPTSFSALPPPVEAVPDEESLETSPKAN